MDSEEEWRPVVGFEGFYEVSSLGRVRGITRRDRMNREWPERIMKLNTGKRYPYHRLSLCKDGCSYMKSVHVLVAEAFLGPCPPGQQVRHGPARQPDGSVDDSAANLSYGTPSENQADTIRDGTKIYGSQKPQSKLTEGQVAEIREKYIGRTWRSLAEEYGVTDVLIRQAVIGATWTHVEGIPDSGVHRKQKLSDDDVRDIRELHDQGFRNYQLAERYDVDRTTISHILAGRSRKSVI